MHNVLLLFVFCFFLFLLYYAKIRPASPPLNIRYGYSIPSVSEQVQEKVSTAIENMTGLTVLDVNVKIAGVNMDEGR